MLYRRTSAGACVPAHPVQGGLHLPTVRRIAAAAGWIIGATQLHHVALRVLHDLAAGDEIGIAQPHLSPHRHSEELVRRVLHEVVALDENLAAEAKGARAGTRVRRMVDGFQLFDVVLGKILDHELERPQHRHAPLGHLVETVADRVIEHGDIDDAVGLGHADAPNEVADRLRWHAAAAQAGQGRHARIVPAIHDAAPYQIRQVAFGKYGVTEIEAGEFGLAGPRRDRQVVEEPVVQRTMVLEFQGTERMRDMLYGVGLAMSEIVGRVDAPLRPVRG